MNLQRSFCLLFFLFTVFVGLNEVQASVRIDYAHADAEKLCGPKPNQDSRGVTAYNPRAVMKSNSRLTFDTVKTYDSKIWVCMKTALPQYKNNNGIGWVVAPEDSQIGYTGGNAYYLGTTDGSYLKCFNNIYKIVVEEETFSVVTSPTPIPGPIVCASGQRLSDNGKYCIETQVAYVQPCSNDLAIKGKSRFVKDRVGGGFWKKVFSFGLSAGGTLIAGGDVGTALKNGAIGVAIQTGQTMINPSEGAIVLSGAGLDKEVVLPRGRDFAWTYGDKSYQLIWQDDVATVYGTTNVAGKDYSSTCYSFSPKNASNLGVYVSGGSNQVSSTGTDKLQPQVPVRPAVTPTNRFPVGTYGYCSRPVAGQAASLCQITSNGISFMGYTGGSHNFPIFGN